MTELLGQAKGVTSGWNVSLNNFRVDLSRRPKLLGDEKAQKVALELVNL